MLNTPTAASTCLCPEMGKPSDIAQGFDLHIVRRPVQDAANAIERLRQRHGGARPFDRGFRYEERLRQERLQALAAPELRLLGRRKALQAEQR